MALIWNNKNVEEKITAYATELETKITDLEAKLMTANEKITQLDEQLAQQAANFESQLANLQAQFETHKEAKTVNIQEQAVQTATHAKDFMAEQLGKASEHLTEVDLREVSQQLQEKGNRLFDKIKTMTQPSKPSEPEIKPEVEPETDVQQASAVVTTPEAPVDQPTVILNKETIVTPPPTATEVVTPVETDEQGK